MQKAKEKRLPQERAINVHLSPAVHERLKKVAMAERRSLRQQIALFLEEAAERFEGEQRA